MYEISLKNTILMLILLFAHFTCTTLNSIKVVNQKLKNKLLIFLSIREDRLEIILNNQKKQKKKNTK